MLDPDAIADAALVLLKPVRDSLPLGDDLVRFAAPDLGGTLTTGFLSNWNPNVIDDVPVRMRWSSREHVQLVVWRRTSDIDHNVCVGTRIGVSVFAFVLDELGKAIAAHDCRSPVAREVNLFLYTIGMDRPLLGASPILQDIKSATD